MKRPSIVVLLFMLFIVSAGIAKSDQKLLAAQGKNLDHFGEVVSISGDYAIIGASWRQEDRGAAYIFHYNGTGWVEHRLLRGESRKDYFGSAVFISGNYAAIGAPGDLFNSIEPGKVYVQHLDDGSWAEEAVLSASDGTETDLFGSAIWMSDSQILIGAPFHDIAADNEGAVYIFEKAGTDWVEQEKLTASDAGSDNYFGTSVVRSGDRIFIGAELANEQKGAVYVFTLNGDTWEEETILTASDGEFSDVFGEAIDADGDYLVVGAKGDDFGFTNTGAAYVFKYEPASGWVEQQKLRSSGFQYWLNHFGESVAIQGDFILIGEKPDQQGQEGHAYLYRLAGNSWLELTSVMSTDYIPGEDDFGSSIDIDGDNILIGSTLADGNEVRSGAAYLFSDYLSQETYITIDVDGVYHPVPSGGDTFPMNISVINNTVSQAVMDLWVEMTIPNGTPIEVLTPRTLAIPALSLFERQPLLKIGDNAPGGSYSLTIKVGTYPDVVVDSNETSFSKVFGGGRVGAPPTAEIEILPQENQLIGNFPNPFNPSTHIHYALASDQHVRISIYNLLGQEVATLADGHQPAGYQSISWDGRNRFGETVASGIYIYRIIAGDFIQSKKMLFAR